MTIEITISNEAQLMADYREELQRLARMAVNDSPDRVGKHYANVTLPKIGFHVWMEFMTEFPIEWV